MATLAPRNKTMISTALPARWPLMLGLAAIIGPTLISVAQQFWSRESGVHGPIVLATGLWLIARRRADIEVNRRPGQPAITAAILVPALLLYTFARAFDFLSLEVAGLGGACLAMFHSLYGARAIRRLWFPLVYLCFVIPLPNWFVDAVTGPLKALVSWAATETLRDFGLPVVRAGVTIGIAQYQLLVEDACAGMNSLVSLVAISLFYIYIRHNASWRYALFLTIWIIPVAIIANIARIIILVLITYWFGDAAAQGFLHSTAGITMFIIAVLGIFLIDSTLHGILRRRPE